MSEPCPRHGAVYDVDNCPWCCPRCGRLANHSEAVCAACLREVVTELRRVWPLLRGCEHDFDPKCARCEWLKPLAEALRKLGSEGTERD